MKRKLQFIILCCLLAVSLASCRSAGSSTAESKEEHTNAKPETADDAAGPEDGTEYGSTESITGNTTGDANQSLQDEDADKESVTGNTAGDESEAAIAAIEEISKNPGESLDEPQEERVMNIQIGEQTFQAVLYENESTKALQEKLPMTIRMDEMNGNEKYYFMDENIPSASETVGSIQAGDIMLFGSNCLVLFFEDFQTSYTYTRLGYVRNVPEFVSALGLGSVEVTFRMDG